MATCDNDHEPITFEGEFRALCPLCAMRLKLAEAEEVSAEWQRQYEDGPSDDELHEAQRTADNMEARCNENEAAISAIVHSEGAEREKAIEEAKKLID